MTINAGTLTFQEFLMREPLPLATIHEAVLEFLRGRDDAILFGAQAVNAYVSEPRMTQDIDLLSPRAEDLVQDLRDHLRERLHIALRVRKVAKGRGFRLFQARKLGNRHLVDVRAVDELPMAERIAGVLVAAPAELIAMKVAAYHRRRGSPKSGTDSLQDPGSTAGASAKVRRLARALSVRRSVRVQRSVVRPSSPRAFISSQAAKSRPAACHRVSGDSFSIKSIKPAGSRRALPPRRGAPRAGDQDAERATRRPALP